MSKVAPHNATIEYHLDGNRPHVCKRYHARYTAAQEAAAYAALRRVASTHERVQVAETYGIDEAANTILVEYVPGPTLWEAIEQEGPRALWDVQPALIGLFATARRLGVAFDGDPSNILLDERDGRLRLIDPTCLGSIQPVFVKKNFEDYAMTVFLWGLLKLALRNPHRPYVPAVLRAWRDYRRTYAHHTGVDESLLNQQISRYIDVVIGWNRQRNAVEGHTMHMFRRVVVVPLYTVVQAALRLEAWPRSLSVRRRR